MKPSNHTVCRKTGQLQGKTKVRFVELRVKSRWSWRMEGHIQWVQGFFLWQADINIEAYG